MVVGRELASALAWSGVGLIAFVPLVGLAVFPLQLAALLLRGLVFEYHRPDRDGRVHDAVPAVHVGEAAGPAVSRLVDSGATLKPAH